MKLIEMTVRAMAMPGKKAHHQLPSPIAPCELDRALPQVASVGAIPKLRKLTNASSTILEAINKVITTMTGPKALGRMWRNVILRLLTPTALAA